MKILEQTLGSETVLEAVKRNELEAAGLLNRAGSGGAATAATDSVADSGMALSSPNSSIGVDHASGADGGHLTVCISAHGVTDVEPATSAR